MNEFDKLDTEQAPQLPAIELDDNGMVVVNDPELRKLVSGGDGFGGLIGHNDGCGWKMN
ncbi:hypothetical protein [Scleromatobacter humisilvae]|uniref:Uncharacterized protein n=1 Tax=Scleromatobacter humisilvae TaxID=2897159 RepID=A0A9X1YIT5_9BURK|nr:hypothetical protein [Scleromatobacter humisilvae]MCK9686502.1 hypothetical protein [Scleromatobacter humisilvae]